MWREYLNLFQRFPPPSPPTRLLRSEIGAAGRQSVGSNRAFQTLLAREILQGKTTTWNSFREELRGEIQHWMGQRRKGRAPGLSGWCAPHPSFPRALRRTDDVTVSWQTELGGSRFTRFCFVFNYRLTVIQFISSSSSFLIFFLILIFKFYFIFAKSSGPGSAQRGRRAEFPRLFLSDDGQRWVPQMTPTTSAAASH